MLDLAVLNGTIISEGRTFKEDVGIAGNSIVLLAEPGRLPAAANVLDASGQLVLPGAVDLHFHCRAPSYPERGDFATETRAAAAGGVTTVFEMPISKPACATPELFRERRGVAERDAYVNFALFAAPGLSGRENVLAMADEGAVGFKIFMHAAPAGREDEFYGLALPEDDELYQALSFIQETGLRCTVHAESNALLEHFKKVVLASGDKSFWAHGASRPPIVEAQAIARLGVLCEALNVPIHIAHLSSKLGLQVLRQVQATGAPMTAETCIHYLLFDEARAAQAGPFAKINPPIRSLADQAALWEGVLKGDISAIVTDHSPFTLAEKLEGMNDIWCAPSGAPGIEMLMPVMLDAGLRGRLDLTQAIDLIARQPAQLFGLHPRKGSITVGADADLVLFDPHSKTLVDSSKWFTRAKGCDRLYNGMCLQGQVKTTVVNGRVVFDRGVIVGHPGDGKFVRPARAERIPVDQNL